MRLNLPAGEAAGLVEAIVEAWTAASEEDDPEDVAEALEQLGAASRSLAAEAARMLSGVDSIIEAVA